MIREREFEIEDARIYLTSESAGVVDAIITVRREVSRLFGGKAVSGSKAISGEVLGFDAMKHCTTGERVVPETIEKVTLENDAVGSVSLLDVIFTSATENGAEFVAKDIQTNLKTYGTLDN